jgi:hypothetical protein
MPGEHFTVSAILLSSLGSPFPAEHMYATLMKRILGSTRLGLKEPNGFRDFFKV